METYESEKTFRIFIRRVIRGGLHTARLVHERRGIDQYGQKHAISTAQKRRAPLL